MKTLITATAAMLALAAPALAEGDAAAGEKEFRKCKSCHMIESPAGESIVKGGRVGPNLYGIIGSTAGTVEDFRYGEALAAKGEEGLVAVERKGRKAPARNHHKPQRHDELPCAHTVPVSR